VPYDPDVVAAARTELNEANARAFARKILAGAPNLTVETWTLAAMMAGEGAAGPRLSQAEANTLHDRLDEATLPRLRDKRAEIRAAAEQDGQ
jgi:hypothetical protein